MVSCRSEICFLKKYVPIVHVQTEFENPTLVTPPGSLPLHVQIFSAKKINAKWRQLSIKIKIEPLTSSSSGQFELSLPDTPCITYNSCNKYGKFSKKETAFFIHDISFKNIKFDTKFTFDAKKVSSNQLKSPWWAHRHKKLQSLRFQTNITLWENMLSLIF